MGMGGGATWYAFADAAASSSQAFSLSAYNASNGTGYYASAASYYAAAASKTFLANSARSGRCSMTSSDTMASNPDEIESKGSPV